MLELDVEKYNNNIFYQSQEVIYVDFEGNDYRIIETRNFGVNFLVYMYDSYNAIYLEKILGGHERFFIVFEEEMIYD